MKTFGKLAGIAIFSAMALLLVVWMGLGVNGGDLLDPATWLEGGFALVVGLAAIALACAAVLLAFAGIGIALVIMALVFVIICLAICVPFAIPLLIPLAALWALGKLLSPRTRAA